METTPYAINRDGSITIAESNDFVVLCEDGMEKYVVGITDGVAYSVWTVERDSLSIVREGELVDTFHVPCERSGKKWLMRSALAHRWALGNAKRKEYKTIRKYGQGYSGGHNTAAGLGWLTSSPTPDACLFWWDTTRQGTWTGYYPSITMVVIEGA